MSKKVGIEKARGILGDLVAGVHASGTDVILTRNGRPVARITTLEDTTVTTTLPLTITRSTWNEEITPHPTSRWVLATERVGERDTMITLSEPGSHESVGSVVIGAAHDDEELIREWAEILTRTVTVLEAARPRIDEALATVESARLDWETSDPGAESEEAREALDDAKRQSDALRKEIWSEVRDAFRLSDNPAAAFKRWYDGINSLAL
ncbi:type II toxin-antitoxin system prevent-host-death family antitoxin [Streptomyces sp. NBC_01237]|uniref:type II toxin-antitoxin system prevent-host-death family antitoxin n=1 Tax=Streptomyces sp. NBC_01237 TaxID=2903790 RepID=UPI002DD8E8EA|nr:type II toxin-antitoxin system prevent-host-death family antitoxin [Streptomyces sp. NBC_01237]WRZ78755.1 type II toxin-antitoxin system Phd/YefM family antitoxin [Streptomyces sp. NBC_01237]